MTSIRQKLEQTFFYNLINQLVYIQISKGSEDFNNKNKVCKLLKALYSLQQALRFGYKRLTKFLLKKLGLNQINVDYSIFVTIVRINESIINIFVDDIKIIRVKKWCYIKRIKYKLIAAFEIIDIELVNFYLDLKVKRDCQNNTLKLFQPIYIMKILAKYYLNQVKPYHTSIKKS